MPSIIRINGRPVAHTKDWRDFDRLREKAAAGANLDREGKVIDTAPIPADSPDAPFIAGVPYEDPNEQVVYRVLARINVAEGWGTNSFWMARWKCQFRDLLQFVRMGWLDAAVEAGSGAKRYRCRDEHRCTTWLRERYGAKTAPKAAQASPLAPKKKPPVKGGTGRLLRKGI